MARSTQAGRQPWWEAALTATILAAGFRRRADRHPEKTSTEKKVDRGWREVMRILYGHVSEYRLTAIAAGVTYFALLAMFPFIGAIVAFTAGAVVFLLVARAPCIWPYRASDAAGLREALRQPAKE